MSGSSAATAPRWPTPVEWRTAAALVLATRAAFWLVAWLAQWLLAGSTGRLATGVGHWRRWDADIYVKIAEHGYAGAGAEPWSEAFLPGWPLVLRAVAALGVPHTVAALAMTTVATTVAVAFLMRLVDEEPPPPTDTGAPSGGSAGRRAAVYLLVFPTAVFLVAGYSEALFLAGAIPAFREARRGRWSRVALPAAVAVATRWTGLFLLAGLAVELTLQLRRRPDDRTALLRRGPAALVAGALPAVAYAGWLAVVRDDPWYFLTAQREGWGRAFVGPVDALRATLATWDGDYPSAILLTWRLEVVAAVLGVVLLVELARRREWGYATYAGTTLAVLLTSSWYYSVPRALLVLFPAVIVLADLTDRRPSAHEATVLVLAPLATLGVVVFTRGGWFF
ncbi:MAG: hypothetical protein KY461_00615 [Actinobacteria bacterium]|nr:hypothetical protein [Actinomycetota bacterium]